MYMFILVETGIVSVVLLVLMGTSAANSLFAFLVASELLKSVLE